MEDFRQAAIPLCELDCREDRALIEGAKALLETISEWNLLESWEILANVPPRTRLDVGYYSPLSCVRLLRQLAENVPIGTIDPLNVRGLDMRTQMNMRGRVKAARYYNGVGDGLSSKCILFASELKHKEAAKAAAIFISFEIRFAAFLKTHRSAIIRLMRSWSATRSPFECIGPDRLWQDSYPDIGSNLWPYAAFGEHDTHMLVGNTPEETAFFTKQFALLKPIGVPKSGLMQRLGSVLSIWPERALHRLGITSPAVRLVAGS